MAHLTRLRISLALAFAAMVAILAAAAFGQEKGAAKAKAPPKTYTQVEESKKTTNLPNPFKTVRDWGELPKGTAKWAAVTAVEVARDGSIYVIHRCADNNCEG